MGILLISAGRTTAPYHQDLVGGQEVSPKSNYCWLTLQGQFYERDLIINYQIFNKSPFSCKEHPNDITPKGLIYSKPLFLRGKAV